MYYLQLCVPKGAADLGQTLFTIPSVLVRQITRLSNSLAEIFRYVLLELLKYGTNVLKFLTTNLIKWYLQTVQTPIRVFTVHHSTKYFKK